MTHTRSLWRMCTECMMVFPDGIAVLPWMMGGTESIGQATAEKIKGIPAWRVSSRGNFYMRWGFCAHGFFMWRCFLRELFATMCYRPLLGLGFLHELRAVQIEICK